MHSDFSCITIFLIVICLDSKLKDIEDKPGWKPLEDSHFECLNNQPPLPPAYLQTTGIVRYFKLGVVVAMYPDDAISYFMEWMCKKFKLPILPEDNTNKVRILTHFLFTF